MVCFLTDKSSFNFNIWEKMDPCNMMHETSIKYSDDPIIHMIKSYIRRPNKFVSCIFYVGLTGVPATLKRVVMSMNHWGLSG